MATFLPFIKDQTAFAPEAVRTMSVAFDEVCQTLGVNGNERAREIIAVRVIELTQRGERDANRLRDRVLHEANGGGSSPRDPIASIKITRSWRALKQS
jgi:hypothetical protein